MAYHAVNKLHMTYRSCSVKKLVLFGSLLITKIVDS